MSKLYEALKRLEKKRPEDLPLVPFKPQKVKNKDQFLLPGLIFVLAVVFGLGLVYLVEWRLTPGLSYERPIEIPSPPENKEIFLPPKTSPPQKKRSRPRLSSLKRKSPQQSSKKQELPLPKQAKKNISERSPEKEARDLSPQKRHSLTKSWADRTQERIIHRSGGARLDETRLLFLAEEARQKGDLVQAVAYLKRYPKLHQRPEVLNNLGALLLLLGQENEAQKVLKEALSLKEDPEIAYNLLVAYLRLDERKEACALAQRYRTSPQIKALEEMMSCLSVDEPK